MKKSSILLAAALSLAACGGNAQKRADKTAVKNATAVPDGHNAESSLDYEGTYTGTLPAADCPGIQMRLTLLPDGTYDLHAKYIDRDKEFDQKGAYAVRENLLTLTPADGERIQYFKVEENRLRLLDADKQPVEGALSDYYVLNKTIIRWIK